MTAMKIIPFNVAKCVSVGWGGGVKTINSTPLNLMRAHLNLNLCMVRHG